MKREGGTGVGGWGIEEMGCSLIGCRMGEKGVLDKLMAWLVFAWKSEVSIGNA